MKNLFSKLVRVAALASVLSALGLNSHADIFYQGRVLGAGGAPVSGANVHLRVDVELWIWFGFGYGYGGNQVYVADIGTDPNGVYIFALSDQPNNVQYR